MVVEVRWIYQDFMTCVKYTKIYFRCHFGEPLLRTYVAYDLSLMWQSSFCLAAPKCDNINHARFYSESIDVAYLLLLIWQLSPAHLEVMLEGIVPSLGREWKCVASWLSVSQINAKYYSNVILISLPQTAYFIMHCSDTSKYFMHSSSVSVCLSHFQTESAPAVMVGHAKTSVWVQKILWNLDTFQSFLIELFQCSYGNANAFCLTGQLQKTNATFAFYCFISKRSVFVLCQTAAWRWWIPIDFSSCIIWKHLSTYTHRPLRIDDTFFKPWSEIWICLLPSRWSQIKMKINVNVHLV